MFQVLLYYKDLFESGWFINKVKAKKYEKELKELNNRKAYLEKWLAEYRKEEEEG